MLRDHISTSRDMISGTHCRIYRERPNSQDAPSLIFVQDLRYVTTIYLPTSQHQRHMAQREQDRQESVSTSHQQCRDHLVSKERRHPSNWFCVSRPYPVTQEKI